MNRTLRNWIITGLYALTCWAVLFVGLAAHAQDTVALPPPGPAALPPGLPTWAVTLITVLMTVGPFLAYIFRLVAPWLRSQTKKGEAGYAFLVAGELAASVVAEVEVRIKPKWVAARADGVVTDAEVKALREEAVKMFLELAPIHLKKALGEMFGDESAVKTYIGGLLERANAASTVDTPLPVP